MENLISIEVMSIARSIASKYIPKINKNKSNHPSVFNKT